MTVFHGKPPNGFVTNAASLGIDSATTRSARLSILDRHPNGFEPVALNYLTVCNKLPHQKRWSVPQPDKTVAYDAKYLIGQAAWPFWSLAAIGVDRMAVVSDVQPA